MTIMGMAIPILGSDLTLTIYGHSRYYRFLVGLITLSSDLHPSYVSTYILLACSPPIQAKPQKNQTFELCFDGLLLRLSWFHGCIGTLGDRPCHGQSGSRKKCPEGQKHDQH